MVLVLYCNGCRLRRKWTRCSDAISSKNNSRSLRENSALRWEPITCTCMCTDCMQCFGKLTVMCMWSKTLSKQHALADTFSSALPARDFRLCLPILCNHTTVGSKVGTTFYYISMAGWLGLCSECDFYMNSLYSYMCIFLTALKLVWNLLWVEVVS